VLPFTVIVGAGEQAVAYHVPDAVTAAVLWDVTGAVVIEKDGPDVVVVAPSDWSDMSPTITSEAALASACVSADVPGVVVESVLLHAASPRAAATSAEGSSVLRVLGNIGLTSVRGYRN
jgi:hypothetical protein